MINTFIIPIIRDDLIEKCLETLYKNTEPNFYVIIVDQTVSGIDVNLRDRFKNLTILRTPKTDIHTTGNLGFSKANNFAFKLVETPYFTMCNDDVEFIHKDWWQGVLDTFELIEKQTPDRPAVMVNPATVKLPDWSVGAPAGEDFYILPYKEEYTTEEWNSLVNDPHYVNERLTIMPGTVIDGVTMYCSVVHTERFKEVSLLNEKFYPGGGEDYDYNCRANIKGYRSVGTTLSWVFHHWSMSMTYEQREEIKGLIQPELKWNNNNELWGENFDIWGVDDKEIPPIEIRSL